MRWRLPPFMAFFKHNPFCTTYFLPTAAKRKHKMFGKHFIRYIHVAHLLCRLAEAILHCSNNSWCTYEGWLAGWNTRMHFIKKSRSWAMMAS